MKVIAPASRLPLALALAYLLVVQMVVAGFALSVRAAPVADGLAAIVCTASGDRDDGGPADSLPSRFDCCIQGCPMLGGLGHQVPPAVEISVQDFVRAETLPAPSGPWPRPAAASKQRTARGPPRAA